MKLRIASDLHLEFLGDYHSHPTNNGRDWNTSTILPVMEDEKEQTLILAGDICMIKFGNRFLPFFRDISERFKQVIIIAGNHEFYRHNFLTGYYDYREILFPFKNIHLMQDEVMEIDDHVLFAATLWTNFDKHNPLAMHYAEGAMSDFRVIEYNAADGSNHMRWTPELSALEHDKTVTKLKEFFETYKNRKKIVLTHHLPSPQCGSLRFRGSLLNPAFFSNLDDLIYEYKPALWIYGHTHDSADFIISNTRMFCNPRGYDNGAENPEFNPRAVIEL